MEGDLDEEKYSGSRETIVVVVIGLRNLSESYGGKRKLGV